jgi:preprotein translocase subunit SecG
MTLVIPQMTIPLMAILALNKIFSGELSKEELLKKLKLSAYITAGVLAIAVFMYTSLEYKTANDRAIQQQLSTMAQGDPSFGSDIVNAVAEDRKKLFGDDLTRTALLVAIAFMLIYLYNKGLFNKTAAIASLVALTAFDMLGVSNRYLNADKFLEPEEYESSFATTPADQQILQDKGNHFRVFNLTQDVFNDAITSYHHRSIGGYHAAKLSIYQDLIENQLAKQPLNLQVLNMLDTKYIITTDSTGNPYPSVNPDALGAAWLVNNIVWAKDAKAEMMALDSFNAKTTAVVQESFKSLVNEKISLDSVAYVKLTQPGHDTLKYESNASSATFAVFSEVYYDKGWQAFVDGKEQPIIKTNYALRGLSLSPGKHEIEFRFVPASYYSGYNITKYSQWLLVLFLIATIGVNFWNKKKKTT